MTEYNRVYNFSAGPSMLPLPVLEKVSASSSIMRAAVSP